MATFKEKADVYAARIAKFKRSVDRENELKAILAEIQRLTIDNKPLNEIQKTRILKEIKNSLKELGFYEDDVVFLESYVGADSFTKASHSISNDEILALMSMVSRGKKI
ncbi:hypothetical protein [Aeromonas veronii]|uniref:hypothetical protein n=1 Tax=Aeromonas veronii TaxID=654 RepID=UPI003D222BED